MPLAGATYQPRETERVPYRIVAQDRLRLLGDGRVVVVREPKRRGATAEPTHRHWSWAKLMQRGFEIDVLAYPQCSGRLRLIAVVKDPREIRDVLTTLGLSAEARGSRAASRRSLDANSTAGVRA